MALSPLFVQGINSKGTGENLAMQTRTVEADNQTLNYENFFEGYDNVKLESNGKITTLERTKTFNLSDFEELDLVSDTNVDSSISVKYNYYYDNENHIIILTTKLVNDDDSELVDTMIGVPFIDDNGNLDAAFECDGEIILLSELEEIGAIENCGWFKNLCKKVSNVAKKVATAVTKAADTVATTVTKAVNTTAKFIDDNADVIVPFAIGVIGGLTGGAAVPILIAGTIAGAAIDGTKTAVASYKATGKVDWAATGISAGIGAVVGFVSTYTGYDIGSTIKSYNDYNNSGSTSNNSSSTQKSDSSNQTNTNNKITGEWKTVNESMSDASRNYQQQITGHTGEAFVQNGVKFDGVIDGNLVDAKCHYSQFVNPSTGEFYDWFNGQQSLIDEANRQIAASNGAHIQWYFAEEETLNAVKALFEGKVADIIEFIFKAPIK